MEKLLKLFYQIFMVILGISMVCVGVGLIIVELL